MAWGFDGPVSEIESALKHASNAGVLLLAAASNTGGNSAPSWPASSRYAICINASDGIGNKYIRSPTPQSYKPNFSTLGVAVEGWARMNESQKPHRVRRTGTSSSTCISAGIAAMVIDIARCQKSEYLGNSPSEREI